MSQPNPTSSLPTVSAMQRFPLSILISLPLLLCISSLSTFADNGCQLNKESGNIECSYKGLEKDTKGKYVPRPPIKKQPVTTAIRKSRSGICHNSESVYFYRMNTYEEFKNLEGCLESGGRLPKEQANASVD